MPTVLQINSSANYGSTGRIAEGIGNHVQGMGWRSVIAYGRYVRPSKSELIRVGDNMDVRLHGLESRLLDDHGLGSRRATKDFLRKVDEMKPDIVHLHNIHGYFLNYKLLFEYLNATHIPVVWTFHDCWSFTGHCSHFNQVGCTKWSSMCEKCPQRRDYPQSILIDRSKNNYLLKKRLFTSIENLTIIPVSEWLGDITSKSFFSGKKIQVIYNGIDLSIFRPYYDTNDLIQKYELTEKKVLIGVASAWSETKGLGDYIKLSKVLPHEYRIVLIGLDPVKHSSLPDNIICIPLTWSQEELAKWYSIADICLNLSYQETFGLTTVEALACGTPGIVYNRTASPELLTEETGVVVEAGDINALLNAIQLMVSKGRDYYKEKCCRRAKLHFDKEQSYKKYIELYKQVINNKQV